MAQMWESVHQEILIYWPLIQFVTAVAVGLFIHTVVFRLLQRLARRTSSMVMFALYQYLRAPSRVLIPLFLFAATLPGLKVDRDLQAILKHLFSIAVIAAVSWLLIRSTYVIQVWIVSRYDIGSKNNLHARKVLTQTKILQRVLIAIITLVTLAAMLMTIDGVRQIGVSLLASAGVAGVVVGFAAQRSLGTLLAGIQVAITQPIRIDDVVVVEGEWGKVEEITLTYVVVLIWDLRRLVLPINYFIEKPFQNWTRVTSDLIGTVFIYTDYEVPLQELRAELERLAKSSPLWDGKTCVLQVTNASERSLELRALVSSADSSSSWDLRCYVREGLIDFIRHNYPQSLPRLRTEFAPLPQAQALPVSLRSDGELSVGQA